MNENKRDMITEKQIREHLNYLRKKLIVSKINYAILNQIDMQSGEGNKLRNEIARIEGQIEVLDWIFSVA